MKTNIRKRILLVVQEFSPYLALTEFSEFINKLAVGVNSSEFEVRCVMPRFDLINEKRYRLHEVLRLTGINIVIAERDYDLHIKVASLPHSRLQVYFLDNVSMFRRNGIFHENEDERLWYADNSLRSFFFCKGVVEVVRKFGWPPDLVHCCGWFTGYLPFLIKRVFRKDPVFSSAKIISSFYEDNASHPLDENIVDLVKANLRLRESQVKIFDTGNLTGVYVSMLANSQQVLLHDGMLDAQAQQFFYDLSPLAAKKILSVESTGAIKDVLGVYQKLT